MPRSFQIGGAVPAADGRYLAIYQAGFLIVYASARQSHRDTDGDTAESRSGEGRRMSAVLYERDEVKRA
jgi:hypothetical protein